MDEETKWQYSGLENKISAEHLKNGEICRLVGIGNSMTPILKSRQPVIVEPITNETELSKKDITVNNEDYLVDKCKDFLDYRALSEYTDNLNCDISSDLIGVLPNLEAISCHVNTTYLSSTAFRSSIADSYS